MAVPCSVCCDSRINHFTTCTASPGVKRPHEIVVFFGIHPTATLWTFHIKLPPSWVDKFINQDSR